MSIFRSIKQRFCKHTFRKHYDKELDQYIPICTKCGKVIYRSWTRWKRDGRTREQVGKKW